MHARNRTWLLGSDPAERCRQRTMPVEGGDGSTLSLDFTTGVLDPRLSFNRDGGGTYVANDGYIYGMDFATSSSLAIGTGSKSVTLTATAGVDRRYLVGQTVWISNGANNMRGPVTAYNASTQVLTINATGTTGSGSFTSWTVGNASARFDHDPTTLAPRGLLIEGSANNLQPYSEDLSQTGTWTQQALAGVTANASGITDPAGGTSASKIRSNSAIATSHLVYSTRSTVSGTAYTMSAWVRAAEYNFAALHFASGANRYTVVFNLTTGEVTQTNTYGSPTGTGQNAVKFGNWWRLSVTMNAADTTSYPHICLSPTGTPSVNSFGQPAFTGTAESGVYVWGAQLETGSGASSYIPTGASQGTRNADHCTMPTSSFITGPLYPQTLFVECIPATPSAAFPDIVRLFDRTAGGTFNYGNEIYYFSAATMSVQRKINSSSGTDRALASGLTYNTRHKFATSIDSSSFLGSYDGLTGSGATTAAAALASQVTHLGVGCNGDATPVSVMFGTVRQIKFFPFAMAQSQLNTLTTL